MWACLIASVGLVVKINDGSNGGVTKKVIIVVSWPKLLKLGAVSIVTAAGLSPCRIQDGAASLIVTATYK